MHDEENPRSNERYEMEQIIEASKACKGMVYKMAEYLGCTARTVYNYRDKYPEIADSIHHENQIVGDTAELQLFRAIQDGEQWAIQFYLKNKGQLRGYVESRQVSIDDQRAQKARQEAEEIPAGEVTIEDLEAQIRSYQGSKQ